MTTEELQRSALLAVACNTIMLEVCDNLTRTTLYKQERKQRINSLTKDLESFVGTIYKGMGEEEEMQYHALVRTVEQACKVLSRLSPTRIDQFTALLMAFESGDIFQASEKAITGMVTQRRVKQLTTEP